MSSGSFFLILRSTGNQLQQSQLKALNHKHVQNSCIFSNPTPDIDILQNTQLYETDIDTTQLQTFYDKNTGKLYQKMLSVPFISTFTAFKQQFNMNPYKESGQIQFNVFQCKQIIRACQYLLDCSSYSYKLQSMLDNKYINILGKQIEGFTRRFVNNNKNHMYLYEEQTRILTRIKRAMIVFTTMVDQQWESEFKLVYKTY